MKFGCFGDISDYDVIESLGFDSIELSLMEIDALSNEDFERLRRRASSSPCKPHVVSRLMPLSERICDPSFDLGQRACCFRKGAERTVALGTNAWVFGCGKPRCLPEVKSERRSVQEKIDALILQTADILFPYGILLVLEPLGSPYSNYIGTVREAVSFIEGYRHKNIAAMCDLRHMVNRGEDLEILPRLGAYIRHAHVDCPVGEKRLFPRDNDGYDYTGFFDALRRMNYRDILTIEAPDGHHAEAGESLLFLKRSLEVARCHDIMLDHQTWCR